MPRPPPDEAAEASEQPQEGEQQQQQKQQQQQQQQQMRQRHGSVGRYSIATDPGSVCSSVATRHWVNSVSNIYSPDEIEELLEDLNRLELAAFKTSDEDFDINGSLVGRSGGSQRRPHSRHRSQHHAQQAQQSSHYHPRDPSQPPSPTFSHHSWDSHALYETRHFRRPFQRQRREVACGGDNNDDDCSDDVVHNDEAHNDRDSVDRIEVGANEDVVVVSEEFPSTNAQNHLRKIFCYCDTRTLKAPRTLLRALLVLTSSAALTTTILALTSTTRNLSSAPSLFPPVLSSPDSSTANFDYFLRLMAFVCIFTVLFTTFVLFLNVSRLGSILPFDFGTLQTVVYGLLTLAFLAESVFLFIHWQSQSQFDSNWQIYLLTAAVLGFACAFECFLCLFNCEKRKPNYGEMLQESSTTQFGMTELKRRGHDDEDAEVVEAPDEAFGGARPRQQQYLVNENYRSRPKKRDEQKTKKKKAEEENSPRRKDKDNDDS